MIHRWHFKEIITKPTLLIVQLLLSYGSMLK